MKLNKFIYIIFYFILFFLVVLVNDPDLSKSTN